MPIQYLNSDDLDALEAKAKQNRAEFEEMNRKFKEYYTIQEKWFADTNSVTDEEYIKAENAAHEAQERWRKSLIVIPKQ